MRTSGLRKMVVSTAAVLALAFPTIARASSFTVSAVNPVTSDLVSASANFTIAADVLTIIVTNTTSGGTLLRGDLLTGIVFDVNGAAPPLTLSGTTLTDGTDQLFATKTITSAAAITGSW